MRQILVSKSKHLCANTDSPGDVCVVEDTDFTIRGGEVKFWMGSLGVVSGTTRFKFSLPQHLARSGVFLLGAYHQNSVITAYFTIIQDLGSVTVKAGNPLLCIESADYDMIKLVESDSRFIDGVLRFDEPASDELPKSDKKKWKKLKK